MKPEKHLLRTAERIKKAMFANDTRTLGKCIAEEYIGIDPAGRKHGRDLVLISYGEGGGRIDRYDTEDVSVTVSGDLGVVSGKGHIHGMVGPMEWTHDVRFLDVYSRRSGIWLLLISQSTEIQSPDLSP